MPKALSTATDTFNASVTRLKEEEARRDASEKAAVQQAISLGTAEDARKKGQGMAAAQGVEYKPEDVKRFGASPPPNMDANPIEVPDAPESPTTKPSEAEKPATPAPATSTVSDKELEEFVPDPNKSRLQNARDEYRFNQERERERREAEREAERKRKREEFEAKKAREKAERAAQAEANRKAAEERRIRERNTPEAIEAREQARQQRLVDMAAIKDLRERGEYGLLKSRYGIGSGEAPITESQSFQDRFTPNERADFARKFRETFGRDQFAVRSAFGDQAAQLMADRLNNQVSPFGDYDMESLLPGDFASKSPDLQRALVNKGARMGRFDSNQMGALLEHPEFFDDLAEFPERQMYGALRGSMDMFGEFIPDFEGFGE